jgi:flagellar hook-associated protein 3 FlgL
MRISERQRYQITNTRIDKARGQNAGVLEKLSTLKDVNRISDNPIGAGKIIRGRDRIKNIEQYQNNIEFAKGYLERTEAAIQGISDNLIRAKELSINLANATYDAAGRQAAAKEVRQVINEVVSLSNTTFLNRFVFSGFRTATPSISMDGDYLGDDGAVFLQIDDNNFRQINVQARSLFEADPHERAQGHFNMIDTLENLYEGLASDDVDQIRLSMNELDFQMEKSTSFHATLGSLYNGLDASAKIQELDSQISRDEISKVEEIDMFKATSDFHRTESILQSTLLASNKLLQPSLLNFLQ